jgi:eukaryotic translation initiation factor 2C
MPKLLACRRDLQFQVHRFTDQSQCFARAAVAPVYYAHLAAAQVRQFVRFDDASETASSASGGQASSASGGQAQPVPELPRLHKNVKSSMFFC